MLHSGVSEKYDGAAYTAFLDHHLTEYTDEDEWRDYKAVGSDPVLHIELTKWADVLLIAPLSANTLAKVATGICDNLLTCVCRAWQLGIKPFIVAPAMNTFMWNHPVTKPQLNTISSWGANIINPVVKTLACGDNGNGALASVEDIVGAVEISMKLLGR